jgi:hypothetical protein
MTNHKKTDITQHSTNRAKVSQGYSRSRFRHLKSDVTNEKYQPVIHPEINDPKKTANNFPENERKGERGKLSRAPFFTQRHAAYAPKIRCLATVNPHQSPLDSPRYFSFYLAFSLILHPLLYVTIKLKTQTIYTT